MPATEQTWRDTKRMHVIFGICSLAMLVTTVWMLAADHRREWKDYQRKFQHVESWTTQARISQQESSQYHEELAAARAALETARQEVPERKLIDEFEDAVENDATRRKGAGPDFAKLNAAYDDLARAPEESRPELRDRLRAALGKYVTDAKFIEDQLASAKKFRAADLDVARSEFDLGVGNELPKSQLAKYQDKVNEQLAAVAEATDAVQNATTYRKRLDGYIAQMFDAEDEAKKNLDDQLGKLKQLEVTLREREDSVVKEVAELPILDAFGRPIKIEQVWLPKLTINYNFGPLGDIARFDRCITCHQAMDKTAPGSAVKPGYEPESTLTLTLPTPAERPAALDETPADELALEDHYRKLLEEVYGLQIAKQGLFKDSDAMVAVVRPDTPAGKATLQMGDVIEKVGDVDIMDKGKVYGELLEHVKWGQPITLTVRRGLPHPFASHPRLDLFMGSLSPHKMMDIGCTVCHDGQGSATSFKWASHSPNDPMQAEDWRRDYGWFDNHHWIYPQTPKRFIESLCLKCHHDVTELEPSERFADPPAPKLVEGFHLIQQFGCYGCHDINGWDGPNKRVGPDIRTEPPYSAAAQALLAGGGLTDEQKSLAESLSLQPEDNATRRKLTGSLLAQETLPGDPDTTSKLVKLLDELESPGKMRRVGPSLRHVGSKVDYQFLYSWIQKPSDFRPSTKMPQFFGLWDHLDGKGLEESKRYEPIEIRAASEYLLAKSQPFEFIAPPKDVTEKASVERGKALFEVRGCLACHQHSDFPAGKMDQGPDLSRIGAKLALSPNGDGQKWLYTWLKNPSKYHARTFMPNLILEPLADADGKLTDPAADITAFLMTSKQDWQPSAVPERKLTGEEEKALYDLSLENLSAAFTRRQAEQYLKTGIPEDRRAELKGDEVELIGEMTTDKQLQYVGRRAITKYGCSGCHDVPGFEDAKPIGTGLADWGRKTPDKLAFEQIVEYLKHGHGKPTRFEPHISGNVTDKEIEEADEGAYGHTHFDFKDFDPDTGYFMEKVFNHQREGFIWQKLREPRSYDFEKTQNKTYNERLRMPQFTALSDAQREAIITFVLGLVAEPPPVQYIYKPTARRDAVVQGLQVIDKFNCNGCHAFSLDRWDIAYDPGDFGDAPEFPDFAFLKAHASAAQIKASEATDPAGLRHATLVGMPAVNEKGEPLRLDEDGAPIDAEDKETKAFYSFTPWKDVVINGQVRPAGLQNILVPESRIEKRYPAFGGTLAQLAYPAVVATEKAANPNAKADEAWGWLPPPLVGEGKKVQTNWLHNFLLDPFPIRPAVVLRMPKFNMSPAEASKLVNYFAAMDNAQYPYDFDPRTRESYLASEDARHPNRLSDALKIVTDGNYCIKCHLIGDFNPAGSERAKAPRLDQVYKRLRPDFTLDWIANPKRLLPYTGMPVNIPHDKGVSQDLYQGTSDQQLNAVVDLLMNYDRYTESKTPIKQMVKPVAPAAAAVESAQPSDAAQ